MKRSRIAAASLAVSAGLLGAALPLATPAQADAQTDAFVSALNDNGLTGLDPAVAADVGQRVCPMLAEPGQQVANVAGEVSNSIGKPLGPATMFTGLAITMFCPGAVAKLASGDSPIPLDMLGSLGSLGF